jgi:hypothetical protein
LRHSNKELHTFFIVLILDRSRKRLLRITKTRKIKTGCSLLVWDV